MTRLVKEKPLGTASGIAVVILILVAVFADVIAPYPYGERHLPDRLRGSSAQYPLGTDHLGRDLLSRIIHGAISEAALSFLGFGLPIEIPSWGGMLSREGRQYMEAAPHLAFWPGLALTVTVYSLNMLGDAVRDLLDPRLIGGAGRLGAQAARSV